MTSVKKKKKKRNISGKKIPFLTNKSLSFMSAGLWLLFYKQRFYDSMILKLRQY